MTGVQTCALPICRGDSAAALRRSLCLQSRPWHRPGYAAGARGPDDGADPRLARNRGPRAMSRTAVVLFNLGGPDRPEAVEPFLFNLFFDPAIIRLRSDEHTSELQSLMRISYAVFCLKKKNKNNVTQ